MFQIYSSNLSTFYIIIRIISSNIIYFVGNAGGYLGLFLGYTLLNVPDFLQDTYNWIKEKFKKFRESKRNHLIHDLKNGEKEQDTQGI